MNKLSMEQITHMWQEAQDQAVTGLPAPVFFANAIAALAARATPAQTVPSPSSVGAAIRNLPLPYVKVSPNGAQTQWGRDMANCGAEVMREHIIALLPKLLSEAAALAEQVQGQQWPKLVSIDDMCAILKSMLIEADEYTDSNIVYRVTFDQLRLLYMKGIAAAPSIPQNGQKSEGV